MSGGGRVARALAGAALVVLLAACGVDTQTEPERIPLGGIPAELRPTATEPVPGGR